MREKTEVERLKEKLRDLFNLTEPLVVSLNGEWGTGKTYFWHSFVKEELSNHLKNKEIAYVSLFGKDSLSDIESDIIMQISRITKIKSFLDSSLGNIGYSGIKVSNVLSLIPKSDFKNIIICFDDFERKSEKLDSRDILGLITQFKEERDCKVIMIYNQEQVDNKEILSNYKDKVIDFELHYKPTVEESFQNVSKRLKSFNSYLLNYLNRTGINNIRIIKRIINALNDFEFIKAETENQIDIQFEIVHSVIAITTINAKYNDFDLENIINYSKQKMYAEKDKFKKIDLYENILFLLDMENKYFFNTSILQNVYYYIKNSILNKEELLSIINYKKAIKNREMISNEISEINRRYHYDLSYSREDYSSELYIALKKGKEYIVEISGVESFIYYIEEIIDIEGEKEYRKYANEMIKEYINYIYQNEKNHELAALGRKRKIVEFDLFFEDYIREKEKKFKSNQIQTESDIIRLFNEPRKNQSWGKEPELLGSVKKETYKEYIINSSDFLSESVNFIRWTQGFSNGSGFDNVIRIIVEVLFELKDEPVYEFKIKKIISSLNLTEDFIEKEKSLSDNL